MTAFHSIASSSINAPSDSTCEIRGSEESSRIKETRSLLCCFTTPLLKNCALPTVRGAKTTRNSSPICLASAQSPSSSNVSSLQTPSTSRSASSTGKKSRIDWQSLPMRTCGRVWSACSTLTPPSARRFIRCGAFKTGRNTIWSLFWLRRNRVPLQFSKFRAGRMPHPFSSANFTLPLQTCTSPLRGSSNWCHPKHLSRLLSQFSRGIEYLKC